MPTEKIGFGIVQKFENKNVKLVKDYNCKALLNKKLLCEAKLGHHNDGLCLCKDAFQNFTKHLLFRI